MKRAVLFLAVAGSIGLLAVAGVHAQFGGGRGGGRSGGMRSGGAPPYVTAQMQALRAFRVEPQWAALSFACELSDSQLVMLRPIMADAWAKRLGILKAAKKNKAWEDARKVMDDLKDEVEGKLKVLLTKDQRKKLKKAIKNNNFTPRTRMR